MTDAAPETPAADAQPRLFVYGTLAPGRSNAHELAGLEATWTPAQVHGHLAAEGWGAAAGFPGILLDNSAPRVDGLLFESADLPDHWERLDEFEGPGYERVLVAAHLSDGRTVPAFIYALRSSSAS